MLLELYSTVTRSDCAGFGSVQLEPCKSSLASFGMTKECVYCIHSIKNLYSQAINCLAQLTRRLAIVDMLVVFAGISIMLNSEVLILL